MVNYIVVVQDQWISVITIPSVSVSIIVIQITKMSYIKLKFNKRETKDFNSKDFYTRYVMIPNLL